MTKITPETNTAPKAVCQLTPMPSTRERVKKALIPMPGARAKGRLAYSPMATDEKAQTSTVANNTPGKDIPVWERIPGLTTMM